MAEFDESKHPRGKSGQFTSGGGGDVDAAVKALREAPVVGIDGEPDPHGGGVKVPFPQASEQEIAAIRNDLPSNRSNLPEKDVKLSDLTAIQPAVGRSKVEAVIRNYKKRRRG